MENKKELEESLSEVAAFISGALKEKIVNDVLALRIFNEGDLQYRVARHIENYIEEQSLCLCLHNLVSVRIKDDQGNKKKFVPDIVIFNMEKKPQIAIELKCILSDKDKFPKEKDTIPYCNIKRDCEKVLDNLEGIRELYKPLQTLAFVLTELIEPEKRKNFEELFKDKKEIIKVNMADCRGKKYFEEEVRLWEDKRKLFFEM